MAASSSASKLRTPFLRTPSSRSGLYSSKLFGCRFVRILYSALAQFLPSSSTHTSSPLTYTHSLPSTLTPSYSLHMIPLCTHSLHTTSGQHMNNVIKALPQQNAQQRIKYCIDIQGEKQFIRALCEALYSSASPVSSTSPVSPASLAILTPQQVGRPAGCDGWLKAECKAFVNAAVRGFLRSVGQSVSQSVWLLGLLLSIVSVLSLASLSLSLSLAICLALSLSLSRSSLTFFLSLPLSLHSLALSLLSYFLSLSLSLSTLSLSLSLSLSQTHTHTHSLNHAERTSTAP